MARVDVGLLFSARDRLSGSLRRLNGNLAKTERQGKRTARSFKSIDLVMGLMAVGTIIAVTKGFVKMGSEMEQLRAKIAVFERGFANVDNVMAELNAQFGKTPFSIETIGASFVRLRAAGLDPLDGSLKALLDSVAAFGGGTQELLRAGIAIQQMAGKGVISMEELRQQLGEAIPFAMRLMAQGMDKSVGELIKAIEKGEVSARVGLTAFFQESKETFDGVAEAMVNTMAGAFERLKKVFQNAADRIFNTFKLGPTIAATLNLISNEIERMVSNLTQEDIDKFKTFFIQGVLLTFNMAKALGILADVIMTVLGPAMKFLNLAWDNLVIGTAIVVAKIKGLDITVKEIEDRWREGAQSAGGFQKAVEELTKKGMEELAKAMENVKLLTDQLGLSPRNITLQTSLAKSLKSIQASLDAVETLPFEQKITRLRDKVGEFAEGLDEDSARLGTLKASLNEALKESGGKITDEIQTLFTGIVSLNDVLVEARGDVEEYNKKLTELRALMQSKFAEKLERQIEKVSLKIKDMTEQLAGTRLEKATASIAKKYGTIAVDLDKMRKDAEAMPLLTQRRADAIARVVALEKESLANQDKATVLATRRLQLEEQMFLMKERAARATLKFDIDTSKMELARLSDPTTAFFDTSRSDQVRETKERLRAQVEQIQLQMQMTRDLLEDEKDPERAAAMRERLGLLREQIPVLEQIAAATTETAMLQRELWAAVGQTIRETLGDAIKSLVKGTGSAKDAILAMFDRITEAAADYIAKLIIMKALQSGMGGGFGGGGGMFGGLLGFGKGGAFKGNVKAFANGDIVRGPTLFGLAGEAGTEAIMPLSRGPGGKLGVQATGATGGDINLTVQAIDQQSGAQFILDHMADIQGGFNQQKALNGTSR